MGSPCQERPLPLQRPRQAWPQGWVGCSQHPHQQPAVVTLTLYVRRRQLHVQKEKFRLPTVTLVTVPPGVDWKVGAERDSPVLSQTSSADRDPSLSFFVSGSCAGL